MDNLDKLNFICWSTENAGYIENASKLNVAEHAYTAGNERGVATLTKMIARPKVKLLFEIYNNVLYFVNQNLGWELPKHASGAINLWFDDKDVMIDVETSDGGVSAISYTKFLEKLEEGKKKDPNYKLSKDDFCDCFC
jgi:hypothetical protein